MNGNGWNNWDKPEAACCPDGYEGAFSRCQSCGASDKWGPGRVTYEAATLALRERGWVASGHRAIGAAMPTKPMALASLKWLVDVRSRGAGIGYANPPPVGPNCRCVTIPITDEQARESETPPEFKTTGGPIRLALSSAASRALHAKHSKAISDKYAEFGTAATLLKHAGMAEEALRDTPYTMRIDLARPIEYSWQEIYAAAEAPRTPPTAPDEDEVAAGWVPVSRAGCVCQHTGTAHGERCYAPAVWESARNLVVVRCDAHVPRDEAKGQADDN